MSTNKTQNYQLHAWAPEDERLRGELNANFTKLDTALKAEATARQGAVNTLNTALAGKAAIVTGTYTGNGAKTRTISLGFQPKAVLVIPVDGRITATYCYYGGLALPGAPAKAKTYELVALTSTGFQVSSNTINHANYSEYLTTNENETVYHYLAVR